MDFNGKTVLVTGASQGIGGTLAQALAGMGAKVACAARSGAGLDEVVGKITAAGGSAIAVRTDVGDRAAVAELTQTVVGRFGGLDAIVNNAALMGNNSSLRRPIETFEREMNVNFYGTLNMIYAALPHLEASRGSILNVSSLLALNMMPGMFAYGVSKMAIERLTLDVATQLAEAGVACNALRIDLPVFPEGRAVPSDEMDEQARQEIEAMGVYAEPLETGAAAMAWMLAQPGDYTGRLESLRDMIARGDVAGAAAQPMPLGFASRWAW